MKRTLFAVLLVVAAMVCAKSRVAMAEVDACYRGPDGAKAQLDLEVKRLADYAKVPRGENTVAELVEGVRLAVADAVACGVPNAALSLATLPSMATKAKLAHAQDAVSIAELTKRPSAELIIAAMHAIDEAASSAGIDHAAIKKLNGRIAVVVKNRLE